MMGRTNRQTDGETDRQTGRQTDRQTDKQKERDETERQTERQTDRQTDGRRTVSQTLHAAGSLTEQTHVQYIPMTGVLSEDAGVSWLTTNRMTENANRTVILSAILSSESGGIQ